MIFSLENTNESVASKIPWKNNTCIFQHDPLADCKQALNNTLNQYLMQQFIKKHLTFC